jgi:low temperature requirement protein LtrA
VATPLQRQDPDPEPREEKRVAPLELFFDLVYVFAVTQVSHLLLDDLSWAGAAHAALALGVVWWAWNYTVWVTSEVDLDPVPVRLLFLAMMFAGLVLAVAVPAAFGTDGPLFAGAYLAIKVGRLLFLTVADAPSSAIGRGRETRLLAWFVVSGVLWVAGAILVGDARIVLWTAALAVDLAGPLVLYWIPGHPRLRFSLWKVDLLHLADRYETFVIIALGETIVLTGATVSQQGFDDGRFVAFALAFLSTACLYWLYFDGFPRVARQHLAAGPDGVHLARDAFMYLHVLLAAGVILSAVGDGLVIDGPTAPLPAAEVAVVSAGPALYLLGSALYRTRVTGSVSWTRLAGALACVVVGLIGAILPALAVLVLVVGVLVVVILVETASGMRSRLPRPV